MFANRIEEWVQIQCVDAYRRVVRQDGFEVSECFLGEPGLGKDSGSSFHGPEAGKGIPPFSP